MDALLATLLVASGHASLDWGARSEARARTAGPVEPGAAAGDLQLDPYAALSVDDGAWSFGGRYLPRLLWADAGGDASRSSIFHRGELFAGLRDGRTLRVRVGQRLAIGTSDFSLLQPAVGDKPLAPERLPALQTLRSVESESFAELDQELSPRLHASLRGSYFVTGGLDAQAQQSLPLQHGGRGAWELDYRLGRLDDLGAQANLQHSLFTTGRAVTAFDLDGLWKTRLARDTRMALGAGGAFVRAYGGDSPVVQREVRPVLSASVEHDQPLLDNARRATGAVRLRLAPSVDRITGDVYQRAEGTLSLELPVSHQWTLAARGGAAVPVEGALRGQPFGSSELEARYRLGPFAQLAAGARASYLGQGQLFGAGAQWMGYLAAAFGDREAF